VEVFLSESRSRPGVDVGAGGRRVVGVEVQDAELVEVEQAEDGVLEAGVGAEEVDDGLARFGLIQL